jgi:WD40 repeat protein
MAGGDPFGSTEPPSFCIWDVPANKLLLENLGDTLNYMGASADYSPDEQAILYLGYRVFPDLSGLATAYVFDSRSGQIIRTFTPGDGTLVRSAAWSPDGSQVATGLFNNQMIIIWDYDTGKQITRLVHGKNETMMVGAVAWSPDGSKFASVSDDSTARVWDARNWEPLYTVRHQPPTYGWWADWSPDGKRLLTTSGNDEQGAKDTTARIWDSATGKELLVCGGHTKSVCSGDWSPNGQRIATASNDGTVRIWDASTGAELLTLSVPVGYGLLAWWSPDGQHLAIVGHETLVSVWRVWQSTEELLAYTRERGVIRQLTSEERKRFGLP